MKSGITQSLLSTLSALFSFFLLYPLNSICIAEDSVPKQSASSAASVKTDTAAPSTIGKTTPSATAAPADSAVTKVSEQSKRHDSNFSLDTILVLTDKTIQNFMKSLSTKHRGSRERGYGGCIGFSPGVYWLNMAPIRSLVAKVSELRSVGFDLTRNYKMISLPGGLLYGGLGNGMRIGLEGRGGSTSIWKERQDTTYFLDIGLGYGGLLLEKAFVNNDLNLIIGGFAGVGGISVDKSHTVGSSGFNDNSESDNASDGSASAFIMVMQMHAAFTYSFLSWIHLGLEAVAPVFISTGGFEGNSGRNITNGFTTFNFGVQFRLILGNLG